VGRTNDVLVRSDGGLVTPAQAVEAVAPGTNSIVDFQVVQGANGSLRVLVVQRDTASADVDRNVVGATIARVVGTSLTPVVERVTHIPLTPGGKLRTLIKADQA
jgi:phenylacetate-coenzyme A ligase PaaK-like adenylate-forming protein